MIVNVKAHQPPLHQSQYLPSGYDWNQLNSYKNTRDNCPSQVLIDLLR
jgi:hypothetical protein